MRTFIWDDSATGSNQKNGIPEDGESVRLQIELCADNDIPDVDAILCTSDDEIDVKDESIYFEDLAADGCDGPVGWFEMDLNFDLAAGQTHTGCFTVDLTYEYNDTPLAQSLSFDATFTAMEDGVAVVQLDHVVWVDSEVGSDGNGNAVAESGEFGDVELYFVNVGQTTLCDCEVVIAGSTANIIDEATRNYGCFEPETPKSEAFGIFGEPIPYDFTGTVTADVTVTCSDQIVATLADQSMFSVLPLPWITVGPKDFDLAVVSPTAGIQLVDITVQNPGTATATVSGVTIPNADTTLPGAEVPFMLEKGASRTLTINVNPALMEVGTNY